MIILAIDPGLANTGYALFLGDTPILVGHIRTTSDQTLVERANHVGYELQRMLGLITAQPNTLGKACVIYEAFFGNAKNLEANYQRGFLDSTLQMYLEEYIAEDEAGRMYWWYVNPGLHLKWFHPSGKQCKIFKKGQDKKGMAEAQQHVKLLKQHGINPDAVCDSVHPVCKRTDRLKRESQGHVLDALALGRVLWHAVSGDTKYLDKHHLQIVQDLRIEYPGLTSIVP